ncbi:ABC transporter permease [Legionella fallonii]|uniref:Putative transporter subunit: membrane component of ABC superfamily n=1 Tax=Legionella fallonii LLAP-10 TaxID=1212491 RepID=A0A098G819_9GAMM|nr:ABC transporter permease [Legionella fallonii]CEG58617.1 putative transporter subunit: membrane component of ABC superfamily [Legionella fallonii LLAP-10]
MSIRNIYYLGIKELISLLRDPILIGLILFAFTISIYSAAMSLPDTLHNAPISIVDEDQSQLSKRIIDAFYPPYFTAPTLTTFNKIDDRINAGLDTFSIIIPSKFEQDVRARKKPAIQLYIDATRISQALTGNEDIQQIIMGEVNAFMQGHRSNKPLAIDVPFRIMFNPELKESWFGAVMELINDITILSIILTGAALIREREHGTVEHLLVMPVTPFEIMASKIWAMTLVVIICSFFSIELIIRLLISMPIDGSLFLFMVSSLFFLFVTTSLGIFLGTFARSMPQFALLVILILIPMQILSGGLTPRESMPEFIQNIMLATPNTHFVMLAQAILFRGAGLMIVWPQFLALTLIGTVLFSVSMTRFRKTLALMA